MTILHHDTSSSVAKRKCMGQINVNGLSDSNSNCWIRFLSSACFTAVEDDCSFGQLKEELSEDERLDTSGTYLILDGITCSGTLVSWQSCFFYNPLTIPTAEVQQYSYFVGILRRSNENFVPVSGSVAVLRNSVNAANMNATYGCDERNVTFLVVVLEGDLIGVGISSNCSNMGACPGHPNLNSSSNGGEVFYHQGISQSFPASDVLNFSNHVPVSINVKALILPGRSYSAAGHSIW